MARTQKPPAVPTELDFARIAEGVGKISDVAKSLDAAGLSRRAIVVLLHDATGLPMKDIRTLLDAMAALRTWCLTR